MIGIIDYGAGNILSVKKALEYLGIDCKIIKSESDFKGTGKIILPGVGAFQAAVEKLKRSGTYEIINNWLRSNRPFLGICLGMQLLFEESEEAKGVKGFEIFNGKVVRFRTQKVPQIGWNQVTIKRESKIMRDIKDGSFFYFLHGYFAKPQDKTIAVGDTDYHTVYSSAIEKGNICAVQFHPEKSGKVGLQLLKNWATYVN